MLSKKFIHTTGEVFKKLRPRISFQIWEIFTTLSLAVTVASLIVFFSSIQPNNSTQEFLHLDQTKSSVYNYLTTANSISHQSLTAQTPPPKDCLDLPANVLINPTNFNSDYNKLNGHLDEIETNYEKTLFTGKYKTFYTFLETSKQDLNGLQNNYNKHLEFIKKSQSSINYLSQLCTQGYQKELTSTKELKKLQLELRDSKFIDSHHINMHLETLIQKLDNINETSSDLDFKEIQDFVESVKTLSSVKHELEEFKFYNAMLSFEDWQEDYLKTNDFIANKVVFIG